MNDTPPPPKLMPRQAVPPPDVIGFPGGRATNRGNTSADNINPAIVALPSSLSSNYSFARSAPSNSFSLPDVPDPILLPTPSYKEPPMLLLPASLTKNSGVDDWANAPHGRSMTNSDNSYIPNMSFPTNMSLDRSSSGKRGSISRAIDDPDFGMGRSPTALSIMTESRSTGIVDNKTQTTTFSSRASILSTSRPHFDPVVDDEESDEDSEDDLDAVQEEDDDELQFNITLHG